MNIKEHMQFSCTMNTVKTLHGFSPSSRSKLLQILDLVLALSGLDNYVADGVDGFDTFT